MVKNRFLLFTLFALIFIGCSSDDGNTNNENQDNNGQSNMDQSNDTDMREGFVPCENGMAGVYPCKGYDLLGKIPLSDFGASAGNDVWGWTVQPQIRNMP